ncbi:MAG: CAP domain-containing protein [Candidatus Paceibacterota bacterium]
MNKFWKKIRNHLVPHDDNGHAPHLLRHESITFLFLAVIILELGLLVQIFFVFNKTNFLAAVLPGVLTALTNDQRVANNLDTLTENNLLKQAAQLKANDMAARGYFSHNTPDGKTPWYFLNQVNYKYKLAGENLAVNFFESEEVARAWMASPSHRANIVKKDYTEIGIAVASGNYEGRNAVFVVQFFGKPESAPKVTNTTIPVNTNNTNIATTINPTVVIDNNQVLGEETVVKTISATTPKKAPTTKTPTKTTQATKTETGTKTTPKTESTPKTPETTNTVAQTNDINSTNEILPLTVGLTKQTISKVEAYINKVLTSPNKNISNLLYIIVGIILGIFITFLIKSEIMHPFIIIRSLALITVIFVLLFVNINLLKTETKIPLNDSSFSAIAL